MFKSNPKNATMLNLLREIFSAYYGHTRLNLLLEDTRSKKKSKYMLD